MISYGNFNQFNSILNKEQDILDLVLSSDSLRAITVNRASEQLVHIDGYHPSFEIVLNLNVDYLPVINHRKYKYRKANYDRICQYLETIDWNFIDFIPLD